jgi:hypothetical protein
LCLKNELGTNPPQEEGMVKNMKKKIKTRGGFFKKPPQYVSA